MFFEFSAFIFADPKSSSTFKMEEVKQRIVSTAGQLFMRHGVKSITMDDVAKECGMSKRTLYEYFSDKESLLISCIEAFIAYKRAEHEEFLKESDNVIEALVKSCKRSLELQDISPLFFVEIKRFYPKVAITHAARAEKIRCEDTMKFLKLGIKQGLFRKEQNLEIIVDILASMERNVSDIAADIIYNKKFDLKEYIMTFLFCFLRGLSTEKGIAVIEKYEKEKN